MAALKNYTLWGKVLGKMRWWQKMEVFPLLLPRTACSRSNNLSPTATLKRVVSTYCPHFFTSTHPLPFLALPSDTTLIKVTSNHHVSKAKGHFLALTFSNFSVALPHFWNTPSTRLPGPKLLVSLPLHPHSVAGSSPSLVLLVNDSTS